MVTTCIVLGCPNRHKCRVEKNSRNRGNDITFHKVKKDHIIRAKWAAAISQVRPGYIPTDSHNVCSAHFKPEDYDDDGFRRVLLRHAVPSVFRKVPVHVKKQKARRRPVLGHVLSAPDDCVMTLNPSSSDDSPSCSYSTIQDPLALLSKELISTKRKKNNRVIQQRSALNEIPNHLGGEVDPRQPLLHRYDSDPDIPNFTLCPSPSSSDNSEEEPFSLISRESISMERKNRALQRRTVLLTNKVVSLTKKNKALQAHSSLLSKKLISMENANKSLLDKIKQHQKIFFVLSENL